MRQIVLDTETTGLSPQSGHRLIEIGCLELVNRQLTGNQFHVYLNPERAIDDGAFKVHGISIEFLQDKPRFIDVAQDFLAFVSGAELIIHNAPFDLGFLTAELSRIGFSEPLIAQCSVVDTLVLAKQKHPGQKNNLDALCKRYDVNNANRTLHGALLDAELLAFVYLAMTGGQINLFDEDKTSMAHGVERSLSSSASLHSVSPVLYASSDELAAHEAFMLWLTEQQ